MGKGMRQKWDRATSGATRCGGSTPQFRLQDLQVPAGLVHPARHGPAHQQEACDSWTDECSCLLLVSLAL